MEIFLIFLGIAVLAVILIAIGSDDEETTNSSGLQPLFVPEMIGEESDPLSEEERANLIRDLLNFDEYEFDEYCKEKNIVFQSIQARNEELETYLNDKRSFYNIAEDWRLKLLHTLGNNAKVIRDWYD